jgi:hypothetical protein
MKHILNVIFFLIVAVLVIFNIPGKNLSRRVPPRPEVFIISLEKHRDFESREVWYLQYALDGHIEQAVFYSTKMAEKYMTYLQNVGIETKKE